jgi:hypothetical protein
MSETEDVFVKATDELIALYRSVELKTLDLPWLSLMPLVIGLWEGIKFVFFFYIGIFLIVPVNIVILIKNFFPGHWNYRPFFLRQLKYLWLWVWRGEAPALPILFIRPLFIAFVKAHFGSRLQRLRTEITLRDDISDTTRGALTLRLDGALKDWNVPRLNALFYTFLLPGIASLPTWGRQFTDFLGFLGVPIEPAETFVLQMSSNNKILLVTGILTYLLVVPITALYAKRGLFIGREPNRIWFPGGQDGGGMYFAEREILASLGLHAREAPLDLWIVGASLLVSWAFSWAYLRSLNFFYQYLIHNYLGAYLPEDVQENLLNSAQQEMSFYGSAMITFAVVGTLLVIAAFRRRVTGRL